MSLPFPSAQKVEQSGLGFQREDSHVTCTGDKPAMTGALIAGPSPRLKKIPISKEALNLFQVGIKPKDLPKH